jgi:hypothetical protein
MPDVILLCVSLTVSILLCLCSYYYLSCDLKAKGRIKTLVTLENLYAYFQNSIIRFLKHFNDYTAKKNFRGNIQGVKQSAAVHSISLVCGGDLSGLGHMKNGTDCK